MSRRWRIVAITVVVIGVVAMAVTRLPRNGPQNPLTDPASVERELLADEPGGALSRTIKRTFPAEFEALKAAVVERARAGGGTQDIQQTAGAFVSDATRRHRESLAQAPVPALRAYLTAEIALVERLAATSPERCAAYFAAPGEEAGWYAPDLRALYLRQNILLWEAAAAARDHPAGRALATATPNPAPVSCEAGLNALRAEAALPDAQFGQSWPQLPAR